MGQYSYTQPSESDFGGNYSSDTDDREVEDLIRRDQAELDYNYAATIQYPPQPEVEFGFPQTCYCGGRPKLATSRTWMPRSKFQRSVSAVELSQWKLMREDETSTYAKILRTMVCTSDITAYRHRGRAGLLEKSVCSGGVAPP
ncbi:hypothetical protein Rs2_44007 [Raphanus sativus]|nr:hypothetical protein Rs2_44007 [Raphanus sativus]